MILDVVGREAHGRLPGRPDFDAILTLRNLGVDKGLLGQRKSLTLGFGLLSNVFLAQRSLTTA